MISFWMLILALSVASLLAVRLHHRSLDHRPVSSFFSNRIHKLCALEESKEQGRGPEWFQQIKRKTVPMFVSLAVARAAILPVGAKVAKKEPVGVQNSKMALKKDPRKDPRKDAGSKSSSQSNKKVVRVTVDVSNDEEVLQQKRKDQLTKIGLAMIALCAVYVILPTGGNKPKVDHGTTPTSEDSADMQQLKPKHIKSSRKAKNNQIDDVDELYPMHSKKHNINVDSPQKRKSPKGLQRDSTTGGGTTSNRLSGPDDLLFDDEQSIDDALQSDGKRSIPRVDRAEQSNKGTPDDSTSGRSTRGRKSSSSKVDKPAAEAPTKPTAPTTPPTPEVPPFATIAPAPASSKLSTPAPPPPSVPPQASAPPSSQAQAAAKKGPGFLGRFFQKAGSGRPADLTTALQGDTSAAAHYRALVTENLLECMPLGSLPDDALRTVDSLLTAAGVGVEDEAGGERQVLSLHEAAAQAGLDETTAAGAYADVTNALLVTLIDDAAATTDLKDATSSVERLDSVASFMEKAGKLYSEVFPGVVVDPIQYNGKVKGAKLEELYYRYLRASMDVKGALGGMFGAGDKDNDGENNVDTDTSAAAGTVSAEQRAEWLGRLQFLFGLKDSKQASLQQRAMKDLMLSMTQGGGDVDFAQLMESMMGQGQGQGQGQLQQNGGGSNSPFPADFDFGSFADAMRTGGELPKNIPGLPDLGDMSPDEVAAMSRQAQAQMRQMLQDGTLNKQEVLDFEKMIGAPVEELLCTMGVDKLSKQQLLVMGPDAAELVDMLQQLAAVKKR